MISPVLIGTAKLYNMDCMEFMKSVPDNHFDLAIVDPPYFYGPNKSGYYGKGFSNLGVARAKHYDALDSWDVPKEDYFIELARISKNQIIWGANHFAGRFDSSSAGWIVWDKDNGKSSFSDGELAYSSFERALRIFKYVWNGMHQGSYGGNVKLNEKRIHPTQKPTALYHWLLTNYATAGQKIFDSHLGSGSHAVAASRLGFDLTGTEKDTSMFNASLGFIDKELSQERLFA